jgi:hypothetical protein
MLTANTFLNNLSENKMKNLFILLLMILVLTTISCKENMISLGDVTVVKGPDNQEYYLDKNGLYYSFVVITTTNTNIGVWVSKDIKNSHYANLSGDITIPPTITLPNGTIYNVIAFQQNALRECTKIKKVSMSENTIYLLDSAFYKSSITDIKIGSSVEQISNGCFSGCNNLNEIVIPNSVKQLGVNAISDCDNLTSVTIGSSVQFIEFPNLQNCPKLTTLNYNAKNCTFSGKINPPLFSSTFSTLNFGIDVQSIPDDVFSYSTGLTSVVIPNSVKSIGQSAFRGCKNLSSVTIGSYVSFIDIYAFFDCAKLAEVHCISPTPPTLKSDLIWDYSIFLDQNIGVFYLDNGIEKSTVLYVPHGSTTNYQSTMIWNLFYIVKEE